MTKAIIAMVAVLCLRPISYTPEGKYKSINHARDEECEIPQSVFDAYTEAGKKENSPYFGDLPEDAGSGNDPVDIKDVDWVEATTDDTTKDQCKAMCEALDIKPGRMGEAKLLEAIQASIKADPKAYEALGFTINA